MKKAVLSLVIATVVAGCSTSENLQQSSEIGKVDRLSYSAGEVYWTTVGELMPTQMNIGILQNDYKLGRWEFEEKKRFEEFCETYGLRDSVDKLDENSHFNDTTSFSCSDPRAKDGVISKDQQGTERLMSAVNTVIVAPNGSLYLTDGHHTFSRFHDMPNGGNDTQVLVRVEDNFAYDANNNLIDMDAFWEKMQATQNAYLYDNGVPVTPDALPKNLGAMADTNEQGMGNDHYRALVYYTRDIGWDKGNAESIPFLEYYWAEELRDVIEVAENMSLESYVNEVLAASTYMMSLPSDHILGDSGKTVKELGQLSEAEFDNAQSIIEEVVCQWDKKDADNGKLKLGKLGWAYYHNGTNIDEFPAPCNDVKSYENRYDLTRP